MCERRVPVSVQQLVHVLLKCPNISFQMAPRKGRVQKEEQVALPQIADGENLFGVAHIYASFNDTFVHVTDLSGK